MTGWLRFVVLGWALSLFPVLAQVVPDLYIVELKGDPAIQAAGKSRPRAAVASEQAAVRQAVGSLDGEVVTSVQTVANALVVRLPDSRAAELGGLPGVAKVYPVLTAHLELDQALPLHRVPEAWTQIGGMARAGAGIKIGIIDSGIESSHPAFTDPTLTAPEGFPKTGSKSDESALNNKIIVVRDYESLIDAAVPPDPKDHNGHGTAVAMVAAGMPVEEPLGTISGVAPKAWLGVYKVFPGASRDTRTDVLLKALDDAVADGMDVVNFSLGVPPPTPRPEDDVMVSAVERASAAGVIVVKSAGNSGPAPNTLSSPASASAGITVGAQWNQHRYGQLVEVGGESYLGEAAARSASRGSTQAPLVDVGRLDPTGLACDGLADGSLAGQIALILRGNCPFETKLNNAERAGAAGAVIYTHATEPDLPINWSAGLATLPALMVSNADGLVIKQRLVNESSLATRLGFNTQMVRVSPFQLGSFSSRGPAPDYSIKPDLTAAGVAIVTAGQSLDPEGELYSASKFLIVDGTSFSAPLVAGAAAVLKSARPGLTQVQYKSLLVNSAAPLNADPNGQNPAQMAGAGMLNLDAALRNTLAVQPASLSFGIGDASAIRSREFTVTNLDPGGEELAITVEPFGAGPVPTLSHSQLSLGPGVSQTIAATLSAAAMTPGPCQGVLRIRGARSGIEARVPYWFAMLSGEPRYIYTRSITTGTPSLYMRVVDQSGIVVNDIRPTVTVVSGAGNVTGTIQSVDGLYPGFWLARLNLGPQDASTFRVEFGPLSQEVTVRSGL